MRLIAARTRLREERGYTMIAVIGAISLVSMLSAATLAATNGDINLVQRNLDHQRAHAAAQAGIADYSFHLNNDNSYWSRCTGVMEPNAVNQVGSTAKRRPVPGPPGATYAIELLPATGKSSCDPASPTASMLESSGANTGSFRIRSTGYAGGAKASIVATYKRASLLDYLYFTQLETLDPVTYWTTAMIEGAYTQCAKFRREGRQSQAIPNSGGQSCIEINFVSGDAIKGPLHTNDDLLICGTPEFGRSAADVVEVSAPLPGWQGNSTCGGNVPKFVGPLVTTAPVLTPPPTNGKLEKIAGPEYTFTGQTRITLNGNNIKVQVGNEPAVEKPIPSSGVVYVKNGSCSSSSYSPYASNEVLYPSTSGCGNAIVHGNYSGQLTIAAVNNIIVDGNIVGSGTGLLGLIANNFVRVYHPVTGTPVPLNQTCTASNGSGSLTDLQIDAAILAINHSFIVDHFNCGASLGKLTVNGAISQKFRGTVGTTAPTGYIKNYNYNDRLRYQEPPNFLDPVQSAWHIQRETLDYP